MKENSSFYGLTGLYWICIAHTAKGYVDVDTVSLIEEFLTFSLILALVIRRCVFGKIPLVFVEVRHSPIVVA